MTSAGQTVGGAFAETRLRLREAVVLGPAQWAGDSVVHHVMDRETGWFYRVGPREYFVFSRLDGVCTLGQIEREYADRFGRRLGPHQWSQLLRMLNDRQLLEGMPDDTVLRQRREAFAKEFRHGRRGLLSYRRPLLNPDRLLGWLAPRLAWLFTPWLVVPTLSAAALAMAAGFVQWRELFDEVAVGRASVTVNLLLVVVTWVMVAVHETAHGLTCKRYGGRVLEIGVMWRFPLVIPYCKTDDVVLFPARRHRVYTAFAGVYTNLWLLPPSALVWWFTPKGSAVHVSAAVVLVSNMFTAMVNLVPFLRLDGYHMLSHALGMHDLRGDMYRFVGRWLRGLVGMSGGGVGRYPRYFRWVYALYGLASLAFTAALVAVLASLWYGMLSDLVGPVTAAWLLAGIAVLAMALVVVGVRRSSRGGGRAGAR